MLKLDVNLGEFFDDATNRFVTKTYQIELEHTLVSLSKWEGREEKPFLSPDPKTEEETLAYIKDMTVTPDVPPEVFLSLDASNYRDINAYIEGKMSATWFADMPNRSRNREVVTAELIYYWMIGFNIPSEYEHWHLNRLFTLLRVCNEKQAPEKNKKMSRQDLAARNRKLNEERKAKLNTTG